MLRRLELTNFKNHASTVMDGLDDGNGRGCVHVLVGPNGAGKSSILEALGCLHRFGATRGFEALGGTHGVSLAARVGCARMTLAANRTEGRLGVTALTGGSQPAAVSSWTQGDRPSADVDCDWDRWPPLDPADALMRAFATLTQLRLHSERIAAASRSTAETPSINPDGYGTATVLADMLASAPERATAVNEIVHSVVPNVRRVFARRRKIAVTDHIAVTVGETAVPVPQSREEIGHELAFETASGTVGAEQASEGTLLVTALAVAMCAADRPPLILLDDVETGLHPTAQVELMRHLTAIATAEGGPQIFVTTHSPFVLDGIAPDHVWVVAADEEGIAHVRRLSEHPRVEEAAALLETGELWTTFGDAWAAEPSDDE